MGFGCCGCIVNFWEGGCGYFGFVDFFVCIGCVEVEGVVILDVVFVL